MSEQAARPDVVWLRGYPVRLGMAVVEHIEDWMREFRLMAMSAGSSHEVPERLQQMVQYMSRTYATELSEPDRLRAAAAARGDSTVDLPYPVRPETAEAVVRWRQLLAAVDEYCRTQDLLTLQRTPAQVAVTDWMCEEFLRQLDGEPPRPWAEARLPAVDG